MPYTPNLAPDGAPKITRDQMSDSEFTYPGKLAQNNKTITDDDFNKAHNLENGVLKWEQVIEQCHRVFSDGNPGRQYNSVFLQAFDGRPTWRGSDADQIAEAYEECCACDLLPDNEDAAGFVGHYFMFKSVKVPDTEKIYRQIPVEYLGPDYKYEGNVTTIDGGGGSDGAAPEEAPAEDPAALQLVVDTLTGMNEEDVRKGAMLDIVKQEDGPFADVRTVLGVSLRGGFVPPKAILLDKLVDGGHVAVTDGVIGPGEGS